MDKQSYLDSIAVKGQHKEKSKPIITPTIIKLLAVGVVLLISMVLIINILNQGQKELRLSYEKLAYTYQSLASYDSPIYTYFDKLKDPELRAAATSLKTALNSYNGRIQSALSTANLSADNYSDKATTEVGIQIANLASEIESGFLVGHIDKAYAREVYAILAQIIALNQEIITHSDNAAFASAANDAIKDLTTIQERFKKYNDTH